MRGKQIQQLYLTVMVETYSNAILVEPLKSRKGLELTRVHIQDNDVASQKSRNITKETHYRQ